ncbi:MAG TPA: helix-turn-helix transcriptional regulator [Herpetosiphonaceae bacterium]
MSTLRVKFGRRLRQLRRYQDLTQEQFAEAAEISVDFVSNMERGISAPSFETLERLADALGVAVADLFMFDDIAPRGAHARTRMPPQENAKRELGDER